MQTCRSHEEASEDRESDANAAFAVGIAQQQHHGMLVGFVPARHEKECCWQPGRVGGEMSVHRNLGQLVVRNGCARVTRCTAPIGNSIVSHDRRTGRRQQRFQDKNKMLPKTKTVSYTR